MKVYKALVEAWNGRKDNRVYVFNEGGSRSGKTIDTFLFFIDLCLTSNTHLKIYCFRDTLASCKEHAFDDFKKAAAIRSDFLKGMQIFAENARPDVYIRNSIISFRGLDKMQKKEGFDSDVIFFNELLSGVEEEQFKNVVMRCRRMVVADWNPRYTQHWAFDYEGRPNTIFTHTTYKDNRHCPVSVRLEIESYEPTPGNIKNKTADKYRWEVYGRGKRCAQEGVIFQDVDWIDEFPSDIQHTIIGIDYGFTNDPTAIVRAGCKNGELYAELKCYTPIQSAEILEQVIRSVMTKEEYAYADSADKYERDGNGMNYEMQVRGLPVIAVKKTAGSIGIGIQIMQSTKIHIVRCREWEAEQGGYVWDMVNGIPINKPIDKFNHAWDALRYAVISELRYQLRN